MDDVWQYFGEGKLHQPMNRRRNIIIPRKKPFVLLTWLVGIWVWMRPPGGGGVQNDWKHLDDNCWLPMPTHGSMVVVQFIYYPNLYCKVSFYSHVSASTLGWLWIYRLVTWSCCHWYRCCDTSLFLKDREEAEFRPYWISTLERLWGTPWSSWSSLASSCCTRTQIEWLDVGHAFCIRIGMYDDHDRKWRQTQLVSETRGVGRC
jgi:hypothetical protein